MHDFLNGALIGFAIGSIAGGFICYVWSTKSLHRIARSTEESVEVLEAIVEGLSRDRKTVSVAYPDDIQAKIEESITWMNEERRGG